MRPVRAMAWSAPGILAIWSSPRSAPSFADSRGVFVPSLVVVQEQVVQDLVEAPPRLVPIHRPTGNNLPLPRHTPLAPLDHDQKISIPMCCKRL
jgi:hypothetical protein